MVALELHVYELAAYHTNIQCTTRVAIPPEESVALPEELHVYELAAYHTTIFDVLHV